MGAAALPSKDLIARNTAGRRRAASLRWRTSGSERDEEENWLGRSCTGQYKVEKRKRTGLGLATPANVKCEDEKNWLREGLHWPI